MCLYGTKKGNQLFRERDTDRQKDKERKIQTYTTFLRLKISENYIQIIFAS